MKLYRIGKVLLLMLLLALGVGAGMTASASGGPKVTDMANLLTTEEEVKLQELLRDVAEEYQCDVAVATTKSCGNRSPQSYTDDFYESNGYGYGPNLDGIILMVCMEERQFHLSTFGSAIDVFTDYGLQQIDEKITSYLSDGEYYEAFVKYGKMASEFLDEYESGGRVYDYNYLYKEKMSFQQRLLISLGVGLVAALIVLGILFAQLKSVGTERRAKEYVRDGSFHVTRSRDVFLYRNVTRRKIERNHSGGGGSRTHRTSGGRRAGGRTGSF